MRPIIILIIIIIVAISIRLDLTTGTIPQYNDDTIENTEVNSEQEVSIDELEPKSATNTSPVFQEVMVESGQTVYGITQQLHGIDEFNVSIQEVSQDFEALNPNTVAHELMAGEVYKFPIYQNNP